MISHILISHILTAATKTGIFMSQMMLKMKYIYIIEITAAVDMWPKVYTDHIVYPKSASFELFPSIFIYLSS